MVDVEDGKHLMEKYAKSVTKESSFGKGKSLYTLKFNTVKDCSTAKYYVIQREFSNSEEGEQLNIWLKATYIHDVLKSLLRMTLIVYHCLMVSMILFLMQELLEFM